MAIVQYTGIINQLRGRLNGSVFNKSKTAYTLGRKGQPAAGWRGNQLQHRSTFSLAQRFWKTLTPSQHNGWATTAANNPSLDRFGQQVTLSGYNQFLKAAILAISADSAFSIDGYPAPAPAAIINDMDVTELSTASSDLGETVMSGRFRASITTLDTGFRYILDVSLPVSLGVTIYHGGWRKVSAGNVAALVDVNFTANLGDRYPIILPGSRLRFRCRILHVASGAIVWVSEYGVDVTGLLDVTTWSMVYNGIGVESVFTIAYSDMSVGVPPFYAIRVYQYAATVTPPTVDSPHFFVGDIGAALQSSNTANIFVSIPPGLYGGFRVDLIWAQSGEVVDSAFFTQQG